jgi:ABC-type sugar transport system substrate-binding protein
MTRRREIMMTKKRMLLLLVFTIVTAIVFTACAVSAATDDATKSLEGKKLKFGQIAHDRAIEWVNYGVMNFVYACNELGVEPVIIDAQNNMEKVLAGMEDLLAQEVDAVSVYSFSPDLDARVAKMARDAGIPIVFENAVPADTVDRDSVTCCTYYDIGYAVAKFIGEKYAGSKFVYIMGQPGMNITEPYTEGIKAALNDGADTEMITTAPTNWTAETAMNATQNVLQSGIEFDVIFANNEQIAQGVLNALEAAELKGKIPVVATGGSPLGVEMLQSGDLDATMAAPTSFMGMMSAKKLYTLVNGGTVEAMTNVPLLPATKDNIEDIVPWEPGPKVIEAIGGLRK